MTLKQVTSYMEKKAAECPENLSYESTLKCIEIFRQKGFSFKCKKCTLVASKEGHEDIIFDFGEDVRKEIEKESK